MTEANFNRLILHPEFNQTVEDLKKIDMALEPTPSPVTMDLKDYIFPLNGELITPIEDIKPYPCNAKNGEEKANNFRPVLAYDESINKFAGLEGNTYFTSHSLVLLSKEVYTPANLLTIYFYTRSNDIINNAKQIKYSDDPDVQSKKDYIKDKIDFLLEMVPSNSILFIDGPLIGGDYYVLMISAIKKFIEKDIIPVFIVKNSSTNIVTDNVESFKGKYNSDMHWAYKYLKKGERTNFFKYQDRVNNKNAKLFTYIKTFDVSPQRLEFPVEVYEKYIANIQDIVDMVYYFMLVQGDTKNPQIRPIIIAEKYARETIKLIDFNKLMRGVGITPTMNQDRFAW